MEHRLGLSGVALACALTITSCEDRGSRGRSPDDAGRDASPALTMDSAVTDAADPLDATTLDASGERDAGADSAAPVSDGGGFDSGPGPDSGSPGCPPVARRTIVDVPQGILPDTMAHWRCENLYVLNGIVLVHSEDPAAPQVLRIDSGVVVHGLTGAAGSARGFLVVTRNGRLEAEGTRDAPIVFTSSRPEGMRARDDWGGITLLGRDAAGATRRAEGFPTTAVGVGELDPFLAYGPVSPDAADPAWSCGTLRYLRVEFASYNAGGAMGNESNALQLYSCGYGTQLDYVQSHLSGDDGIELFGGQADVSHLVVTGASDDSVDWDDGYHGRMQFIAAQQHPDAADFGIEAGGSGDAPALAPDVRLFNATFVGSNGMAGQIAARLRGASRGHLRNLVFLGFTDGYLDIGGATAAMNLVSVPPLLSIRNSVLWQGAAPIGWPTGSDDTADGSPPLIEADFFVTAEQLNHVTDPMLGAPFDRLAPDWSPRAGAPLGAEHAESPSETPGDTRPPFFDTSADYVGALSPEGPDWTAGWTAYPAR